MPSLWLRGHLSGAECGELGEVLVGPNLCDWSLEAPRNSEAQTQRCPKAEGWWERPGQRAEGAEGRSVSQTHPERRLKAQISAAKRRYDYPKGASAQGCGWTWSRKNLDDFYAETITPAEMSSVTWTPTETGQDKWYLPSTEQWSNQSRETALSPRPLPSPPPT